MITIDFIPYLGISITSIIIIYQDFKNRLVSDWAWYPAVFLCIGFYGYEYSTSGVIYDLAPLLFAALISFAVVLVLHLKLIGPADGIALVVIALIPSDFIYVLLISLVLTLVYLLMRGRNLRQLMKSKSLNTPFAAYLGCSFLFLFVLNLIR